MRQHWPALLVILVVAVLAIVGIAAPAGSPLGERATWLFGVASALLALSQYLAQRVDTSRLALQRMKRRLFNDDVTVELVLEALFAERPGTQSLANRLRMATTRDVRVVGEGPNHALFNVDGLSFHLQISAVGASGDRWAMRLHMPASTRSYRSWSRAVNGWLFKVIDDWYRALSPEQEKLSFEVRFDTANPYFDFSIDDIAKEQIVRFDVEYVLPSAADTDVVTLTRDGVKVVTSNRSTAQRLAAHYVSLRPLQTAA